MSARAGEADGPAGRRWRTGLGDEEKAKSGWTSERRTQAGSGSTTEANNAQESTGDEVGLKMTGRVGTAATRYRNPRGRGLAQAGRNVEEGSPRDERGNVRVNGERPAREDHCAEQSSEGETTRRASAPPEGGRTDVEEQTPEDLRKVERGGAGRWNALQYADSTHLER